MNNTADICLRVSDDLDLAREWELVLLAQGLSPSLRPSRSGTALYVPEAESARARTILAAYDDENARKLVEQRQPAGSAALLLGSIAPGIFILWMFWVTMVWLPNPFWFELGGADADRILSGELWRTVTALTLHADVVHAASNAVAAALFIGMVSSLVGWGLSWALVLFAGAGGNLANALLHGSSHAAIGASTAVFGAVGLLSGLAVVQHGRNPSSTRRAWLPIAAALALLGMLGTGGLRVDIWAHLCGLLVGAVLGIVVGNLAPRPPGPRTQWLFGSAAVWVILYSWMLASR